MFSWISGEKDPHPPTKLDKQTGQQLNIRTLWKTRVGKGSEERQLSLVAAIEGDRLYAADARGRVESLSARDGREIWQRNTDLALSGGPEVKGERLVLGSIDGDLLMLSTRDGAEKWRTHLNSEILSIPRIVGNLVVVHTIDDDVYGIDLADGKELWRYIYPAPTLTLHGSGSPVIAGEGVIVGISGGRLVQLELEQGAPVWEVTVSPPSGRSELERIADIDADPVVVGDIVYVGTYNGDLAAVDILTGAVLWRRELSAYAGLAAEPPMLYITDADDNLWAAEIEGGSGRWKQERLLHRRLTAPAIDGNYLVVGDVEGYVHFISKQDGRLLGRVRITKAPIGQRPLVVNGIVYVFANDGTLAALSASPTGPSGTKTGPPPGTAAVIPEQAEKSEQQ